MEGDDRKFSYFSGGKKSPPTEGAFIKLAKYEKVVKGQYTNYNVKELTFDTGQNNEPRQDPPDDYDPPGEPAKVTKSVTLPKQGDEKISFYVSYAKDIATALIMTGNVQEAATLDTLAAEVMETGIAMWKKANSPEVPF